MHLALGLAIIFFEEPTQLPLKRCVYCLSMDVKKLVLGIHDLNSWGGQERSNLEIYYRVGQNLPIELHAYTFADSRPWPQLTHVPYSTAWASPILLKINHYHLQSLLKLQTRYPAIMNRKDKGILIQSTGTALPYSDVVQVQFVHKAWIDIEEELEDTLAAPETFVRSSYSALFNQVNIFHEKLIYTNNKKYVAISHSVKKELMAHYDIKPQNISVIYHGVNASEFRSKHTEEGKATRKDIRQKYGITEDSTVLLTVGALNTRKGLHIILETLKELIANDFKSVTLLAVGAGDPQQFMALANQWGIASHIHVVSAQKDVTPFYQASDIFFFPTLYEPFGLVILEAMASGLPVITSSIAGAAELITPGIDGIVIDPQSNITDIASEISLLIKDKSKQNLLGQRAHQSAQQWSWDNVADQYIEFYKSL